MDSLFRKAGWVVVTMLALCHIPAQAKDDPSNFEILQTMASDYAHDPAAEKLDIGFDIGGDRYFMRVGSAAESGEGRVEFQSGFPDFPVAYWKMSRDTLLRLHAGMTGETATSRERAEDPRLMYLETTENFPGFLFSSDFWQKMMNFKVHFFATGQPEIIPLKLQHAVTGHGASTLGIHYAPRVSIFWVSIGANEKVNTEEGLDINPFETVFVAMSGKVKANIGGKIGDFEAGNALMIPKDVSHKFWNPYDEPMSGVMILFGEGLNE